METPRPAPANPGVRLAGRTTGRTGSMTDDPPGKRKGARANREGKPWQRADGRWTVRVWPPAGVDRKPRYVYGRAQPPPRDPTGNAVAARGRPLDRTRLAPRRRRPQAAVRLRPHQGRGCPRWEEHTPELQALRHL